MIKWFYMWSSVNIHKWEKERLYRKMHRKHLTKFNNSGNWEWEFPQPSKRASTKNLLLMLKTKCFPPSQEFLLISLKFVIASKALASAIRKENNTKGNKIRRTELKPSCWKSMSLDNFIINWFLEGALQIYVKCEF